MVDRVALFDAVRMRCLDEAVIVKLARPEDEWQPRTYRKPLPADIVAGDMHNYAPMIAESITRQCVLNRKGAATVRFVVLGDGSLDTYFDIEDF